MSIGGWAVVAAVATLYCVFMAWSFYTKGRDRERSDAWWRARGEPTMKEFKKAQRASRRERERDDEARWRAHLDARVRGEHE